MDVAQEHPRNIAVDSGSEQRIDDEVHCIEPFWRIVDDQSQSLRNGRVGEGRGLLPRLHA